MKHYLRFAVLAAMTGCATTNDVAVELAPDLISSLDGKLSVHVLALSDRDPVGGDKIDITAEYTDRNGTPHDVTAISGTIDDNGAFEGELTGLAWDGIGTVTAVVHGGDGDVTATAAFAVLDRTPPTVTITGPSSGQVRINQDTTISVHVLDEIGVSQVWFETSFSNNNGNSRDRSTVVASGSLDSTVRFDFKPQDTQVGATVTLYALAADLSGNQAAAKAVTLTVVP